MTKDKNNLNEDEVFDNTEFNDDNMSDAINEEEISETGELKIALTETQDKYTRLVAEFDNFKKRTAKERMELFSTANMDVMVALIPVLDDLERAVNACRSDEDYEGFNLVLNKFKSTLEHKGLKSMNTEVGNDFDVDFHEAITSIPAADEKAKGKIVDVIEKGYKLGEKVIRYAKVVIGE